MEGSQGEENERKGEEKKLKFMFLTSYLNRIAL
jgi:hypothetical protein